MASIAEYSIIITNKKSIAIAPTYTIKNSSAIYSKFKEINKITDEIKATTNQNTECTGLNDEITIVAALITPNAEMIKIKSMCNQGQVPLLSLCYDLLCLISMHLRSICSTIIS